MPEPLRARIAKELDGHWTTDQRDAHDFAQCACGEWHWEEHAARHRADTVMAVVQPELDRRDRDLAVAGDAFKQLAADRDQYAARVPLVCSDERHTAKVRGLEARIEKAETDRDFARRSADTRGRAMDEQQLHLRESEETVGRWRTRARKAEAERDRYRLAWQSARKRGAADAEQLAFIHAVLRLALAGDFRSELLWRSDGQQITVSVDVSDVFAWGGGDAEDLTPERLPILAEAMADLRAVHPHDDMYTVDLYAARIRGMRPQGAAYPKERAATQALFDACGPGRATGLGNPRPVPTPTQDGQP